MTPAGRAPRSCFATRPTYSGRQLRYKKKMQDVEGAPDGEYYFLIYGSSFANKDSVIETLTLSKEKDGLWKVSGYTIE